MRMQRSMVMKLMFGGYLRTNQVQIRKRRLDDVGMSQ